MDIASEKDLEKLMDAFYSKAIDDHEIGFFFTEVVQLDLEAHKPVLVKFWSSILLDTYDYSGNAMRKHVDLHHKHPMEARHFERWLELFNETVDELFVGDKARLAKERALSIATAMRVKLTQN